MVLITIYKISYTLFRVKVNLILFFIFIIFNITSNLKLEVNITSIL